MNTTLPTAIASVEEAQEFLTDLHNNNEAFHPEDDAHHVDFSTCVPAVEERQQLNKLMREIYELNEFDPCDFLMDLGGRGLADDDEY